MTKFNRIVVTLLWLCLLILIVTFTVVPLQAIAQIQTGLVLLQQMLQTWKTTNSTNFVIAQAAVGSIAVLVFGVLLWLELWTGRQRGVRIRTPNGGSAEIDPNSVGRRLEWHLEQVSDVLSVVPGVKSRRGAVDVRLEIEVAPNVDIPMKTSEVVDLARDIIVEDIGLRLGKLDVRLRCAPFEPNWVA